MKYVFYISITLFIVYLIIGKVELGGISILLFIISGSYLLCKNIWQLRNKTKKTTHQKTFIEKAKITVGDADGAYYCKIAGVQYRCTNDDVGGFLGYVRSDKNNPHDKNSIAVYNNDNKLLGYIPKENQSSFREYSEKDDLPCVGFINVGNDVPLYGKVKIIDSDTEETKLIITKYVHWLISTFGVRFVPSSFSIDVKVMPKTKKEWIETLDYYIDKMENELYEEI